MHTVSQFLHDGVHGTPYGTAFLAGNAFEELGQAPRRAGGRTRGAARGLPDAGQEAVFGLGGVLVVAGEVVAEGGVFAGGAEDVEDGDHTRRDEGAGGTDD